MNNRELLQHHIYFLSKHRGRRESLPNLEIIQSDKPFFNMAFPLSSGNIAEVKSSFNLYLPDWVEAKGKADKGREKLGTLTYMILTNTSPQWKINQQITVKKAANSKEIEDFSLVQGHGFCETPEEFDEWYPWLREQNFRNFDDENQSFNVAYHAEKPVSVSLAIKENGLLGIYAVATLPNYRNQGFSTSLLKNIIEFSQNIPITLQVKTNSYPHLFYRNLGFKDVFECSIFAQKKQ